MKEIPFGAALLPPRLNCDSCSAVWELAASTDAGAVQIGNAFFVRVDTGRQN